MFAVYFFVFPSAPPSRLFLWIAILYGGSVGGCTGSRLTRPFGNLYVASASSQAFKSPQAKKGAIHRFDFISSALPSASTSSNESSNTPSSAIRDDDGP